MNQQEITLEQSLTEEEPNDFSDKQDIRNDNKSNENLIDDDDEDLTDQIYSVPNQQQNQNFYPQNFQGNQPYSYNNPPTNMHPPNNQKNNFQNPPQNINDPKLFQNNEEESDEDPNLLDDDEEKHINKIEPPAANNIDEAREDKLNNTNDRSANRRGKLGGDWQPINNSNERQNKNLNNENSRQMNKYNDSNNKIPNQNNNKDQKVVHYVYNTNYTYNMGDENNRERAFKETERHFNNQNPPPPNNQYPPQNQNHQYPPQYHQYPPQYHQYLPPQYNQVPPQNNINQGLYKEQVSEDASIK